jgi:hypothetical protein
VQAFEGISKRKLGSLEHLAHYTKAKQQLKCVKTNVAIHGWVWCCMAAVGSTSF